MSDRYRLHAGDCREVMRDYPADHFDSIVSDPPYGLSFMGNGWDHGVPGVEFWAESLRVAKPGAHLLAFGGTRTYHRLACAIEDAGWEIRDCVMWVYGSGFPKSHDVSKAIDKAAGAEREVVSKQVTKWTATGRNKTYGKMDYFETEGGYEVRSITAPATDSARQWSGWGTALKPAWEPIIVARKPLVGTVAANVTRYGTGALNIDGCRLPIEGVAGVWGAKQAASIGFHGGTAGSGFATVQNPQGRWPANVMHDGSDEVLAGFPGDEARFFYCPKASNADREEGNTHPTVKPTDLMRYLCRLVTPTDGLVLDPFMGSGSTGKGALLEGFRFVGIDLDPAHVAIAEARCQFAVETVESECAQLTLF